MGLGKSPRNVTYRLNPKRAEPRHLSHKGWISAARFELGVWRRIKGQYRTGQEKSQKRLYLTYLGRSPHWSDLHQKLCRWPCRRNHVCQVSKWNFPGLRFYRGSNFPFSYWFLNGPYNSAAILRCLWWYQAVFIWHIFKGIYAKKIGWCNWEMFTIHWVAGMRKHMHRWLQIV